MGSVLVTCRGTEGNLSDRQLLITTTDRAYGHVGALIPDRTPAQTAAADAAIGRFAATLGARPRSLWLRRYARTTRSYRKPRAVRPDGCPRS